MGTPYMVFADLAGGAAGDEPNAFSVGGTTLYRSIAIDRVGDYVNTSGSGYGSLWTYDLGEQAPGFDSNVYCAGGNTDLGRLYCSWGGQNGVYWEHGDQNPLVPYNGRLYSHHSNTIIVYGTGTSRGNLGMLTANTNPSNKGTSVNLTDLKSLLESEISKIVAAGHLRPGYYNAGQFNQNYWMLVDYFSFPSETLYTLANAYPYVDNPTLKAQLKTYIDTEYQNYFLNGRYGWMGWDVGAGREWALLPPEVEDDLANFTKGGTSDRFGIYALWKYYQNLYLGNNTKRTEILNIANQITGNSGLGDIYDSNRNMAGTVGLGKIQKQNPNVNRNLV